MALPVLWGFLIQHGLATE